MDGLLSLIWTYGPQRFSVKSYLSLPEKTIKLNDCQVCTQLPIITNKSFFVKFKILQEFGIWLFLLDANLMWCFDMDVIGRGRKNGETLNL